MFQLSESNLTILRSQTLLTHTLYPAATLGGMSVLGIIAQSRMPLSPHSNYWM